MAGACAPFTIHSGDITITVKENEMKRKRVDLLCKWRCLRRYGSVVMQMRVRNQASGECQRAMASQRLWTPPNLS